MYKLGITKMEVFEMSNYIEINENVGREDMYYLLNGKTVDKILSFLTKAEREVIEFIIENESLDCIVQIK